MAPNGVPPEGHDISLWLFGALVLLGAGLLKAIQIIFESASVAEQRRFREEMRVDLADLKARVTRLEKVHKNPNLVWLEGHDGSES